MDKAVAIDILRKAHALKEDWAAHTDFATGMLHYMMEVDLNGSVRVQQLAAEVGFTQQATGKMLKVLDANGLIDIVKDKADKRSKIITLTDQGRKAIKVLEKI
jgi:DNA-binding MarR family transcriptional regulator